MLLGMDNSLDRSMAFLSLLLSQPCLCTCTRQSPTSTSRSSPRVAQTWKYLLGLRPEALDRPQKQLEAGVFMLANLSQMGIY